MRVPQPCVFCKGGFFECIREWDFTAEFRKRLVGERGFEPPTPWSRTRVAGTNFVATQSFEWCFNRLILAQSRQFWRNVNPELQTSTIGSPWFALGGAPNLESFPLTDSHTPTVVRTY